MVRLCFCGLSTGTPLPCWQQADVEQILSTEAVGYAGISLSIRIHTRESSLCSIIRVQQKPLPNRTVLFSKVLLYRISSSLWPLVKQGNKLGEGRQVKYRRPKPQMTVFFWRICTYTWFGLKASFLCRLGGTKNFLCFSFYLASTICLTQGTR